MNEGIKKKDDNNQMKGTKVEGRENKDRERMETSEEIWRHE